MGLNLSGALELDKKRSPGGEASALRGLRLFSAEYITPNLITEPDDYARNAKPDNPIGYISDYNILFPGFQALLKML